MPNTRSTDGRTERLSQRVGPSQRAEARHRAGASQRIDSRRSPQGGSDTQPSQRSEVHQQKEPRQSADHRPSKRGLSRSQRSFVEKWRRWGIAGFAAVMGLGCLIGLLIFARPGVSEVENRSLTQYPDFTLASFMDGEYFSELSLWYADTFPLREPMVRADLSLQGLFGVQPETRMIGGNRVSDEIPVGEDAEQAGGEDFTYIRTHDVSEPEARAQAADIENQIKDGVYVTPDACYTLYYFSKEATQNYARIISDAADMLDGKATVYSILLPTNAGVMLDDETLKRLGVPDQEQAIDYFYSCMSDKVQVVPTFQTLSAHKDEYLYFRTDFHWTQLAAYYVYLSFCETKGIEPCDYWSWEEVVYAPYRGEYKDITDISTVASDAVNVRVPSSVQDVTYWTDDLDPSTEHVGPVISDLSNADADADLYQCFVQGNRPLSHIENPNLDDGSTCLVVKDSFGNPMVSTMVDNYQHIYAVDFRYTHQKLEDLVERYGIQDVIFENVIMFAGTNNCASLLSSIVY